MMRNQQKKKCTSATFLNFSNFASFFSCSSLSRSAAPSTYLIDGNQSLISETNFLLNWVWNVSDITYSLSLLSLLTSRCLLPVRSLIASWLVVASIWKANHEEVICIDQNSKAFSFRHLKCFNLCPNGPEKGAKATFPSSEPWVGKEQQWSR